MAYLGRMGPYAVGQNWSKKVIFNDFLKVFLIVPRCYMDYVGICAVHLEAVSSPQIYFHIFISLDDIIIQLPKSPE